MEYPIALVSGANRGIGRAVAEQLTAAGVGALIGSRDLDAGRAGASEIESVPPVSSCETARRPPGD